MKFILKPAAREDILRQFWFYSIEKQDDAVALRFLDAVESTVAQLCRQPEIGALKRLAHQRLSGLRSWPVKGFRDIRVYYLSSETVIRIVRILHGKRDIDSVLGRD